MVNGFEVVVQVQKNPFEKKLNLSFRNADRYKKRNLKNVFIVACWDL